MLLQKLSSLLQRCNKIQFVFLLILISIIPFNKTYATHAAGADLQYRWLFGRTYEVTVSFYRDCSGVAAPPSLSLSAVSASCGVSQDYTLNLLPGAGQEITFPCRSVQTVCTDVNSAYAGYQQYIYQNTVTLPQNCSDWNLSFFICCRNCAITTISTPCTENLYIEATLNNILAPENSSPQFTNIPVAFLCINQSSTYNHGVYDPDGDSLVYSFITPRSYNNATFTVSNVSFLSGFSASSPLSSSPAVSLDPVNGDIVMTPTVNGEIGIAAILVREYRNGVLIGSVVRDMQFITKVCNPNFLPAATGINGTTVFDTSACVGSNILFKVFSSDANASDTVTMTWNNVISGASFVRTGALRDTGTFSWTPSASDARSQPHTFIITVRDNACPLNGSQTYSYSILVPDITANATSPGFNGYNVACRGGGTASATVSGTGGGLPYTYNWNPSGQATQTAVNLNAGTYTAKVTDVHGCSATDTITITEPPAVVSISVSTLVDVSCNGGSNGNATVAGAGGVGPYTYSWSSGQTTAAVTGLSANNYTATVTDANGCTAQQSIVVNQPTAMNASIATFQNVTCLGNANGSISSSVNGGTPPYTHHWSNGANTDIINGLAPGTYSDTIRDSKGCTRIISQVITQPGTSVGIPSTSAVDILNVSCNGLADGEVDIQPSGGTGFLTITWSNGDVGQTADSLSAGTYSLHISDFNGCTFDTIITVTEPAVLTSAFVNVSTAPSGTNIGCNGDTTGRAKVLPIGGTAPYTYSWSNGSTSDSIYNAGAGVYIVTINDSASRCSTSDTITLTEPSAPLDNTLSIQNVGCHGEASGGIGTNTTGGSPPYVYQWSNGPAVTDSIGNLIADFYLVVITDMNNCQVMDTVTISEPDTIVPLISSLTFGSVNIACNGQATGSASVSVSGGTPPFSYLWSSNSTDSFAVGLDEGWKVVRVEDSNGCSLIDSIQLSQALPFFISPVEKDPACYGDNSGQIIVNLSGGSPPYNYNWSNSANGDTASLLTAGLYDVIILDANNCRDSLHFSLSEPDSMTVHANVSDFQGYNVNCNNASSAFIAVHPTGGTGAYTYLWSNSATTDSISNLNSGNYSVTITDVNGCTQDTAFLMTQPPPLNPSVTLSVFPGGMNVSCNGYIDGVAHSQVSGGVAPYQYLWSNGDVSDSAVGLGFGPHSLMVTDSNGCTANVPFSLTQPPPVSLSSTITNFNGYSTACSGDSSGCITINTSGGTAPYSYVWDVIDTITTPIVCNLPADTFSLRIIDANGCQLDTFFILIPPPPVVINSAVPTFNGFEIQCNGNNDGSIDVTVSGGVSPFSYAWSNTATTQDINNLPAGNYMVYISDANACLDSLFFTLNEPPALTSVLTSKTDATCNGMDDGAAIIDTAIGGVSPYSYSWSNGESGLVASALPVDTTIVTIMDANGCIDTINVIIVMGECILELPTAITPNGDGFNDFYVIHGLGKYPRNFFKVFNRWGNEVFSKEDYTNVDWYGQDEDGGNLPDGTYFVTFVVKGEDIRRNTYVDLRR